MRYFYKKKGIVKSLSAREIRSQSLLPPAAGDLSSDLQPPHL